MRRPFADGSLTIDQERIIAAAREASREDASAMQAAVIALLDQGVALADIEIASVPSRGPGAWTVRKRPAVCVCGRAVMGSHD